MHPPLRQRYHRSATRRPFPGTIRSRSPPCGSRARPMCRSRRNDPEQGRACLRRTPRKPKSSSARDPHSANRSPRKEFPRRSPALEEAWRTLRFLRHGTPCPGFVKTAGCEHQRYSVRLADLILCAGYALRGDLLTELPVYFTPRPDVLFTRKPLRRRMCQHRCKNYTLSIIPYFPPEVNTPRKTQVPKSDPIRRNF